MLSNKKASIILTLFLPRQDVSPAFGSFQIFLFLFWFLQFAFAMSRCEGFILFYIY